MSEIHALQILAGPRARAHLRERGLRSEDVRVIPAAAGGPKGLALNPLDRFIFGHWLPASVQTVHLMGASIGAWRMATACAPDADAALRELAENYILQSYPRAAGQFPKKRDISRVFAELLASGLGQHAAGIGCGVVRPDQRTRFAVQAVHLSVVGADIHAAPREPRMR